MIKIEKVFPMLIIWFLIANAIFWGLFSHEDHCNFMSYFTNMKCPSHNIHLLMGFISYGFAVYVSQKDNLIF